MNNQDKFIEMIDDVTALAKLNNREVTVEFLKDYFKEINLDENQMMLVYKYMTEHNIKVLGYDNGSESSKKGSEEVSFSEKDEPESEYLNLYLDEVKMLKENTLSLELFDKMSDGDETSKEIIVKAYLPKVIAIADDYRNQGLSKSDLIQEGNIGLLMGLASIDKISSLEEIYKVIDASVRDAMIQAIDELSGQKKTNNSIIKKADFVKEKAEELAETMNDKMTMEDMAEYMDMDLTEIQDILRMTGEEL